MSQLRGLKEKEEGRQQIALAGDNQQLALVIQSTGENINLAD